MGYPKHPGIYAIRHAASGRSYIGSAREIYRRWRVHKSQLRRGVHHSPHLQNAWNKYGEAAFDFVVLETCFDDRVMLRHREQTWLDRSKDKLFNSTDQAVPGCVTMMSEESRAIASERMKGNKRGAGTSFCGVLREVDIPQIIYRYAKGERTASIARSFKVHAASIKRVAHRLTWGSVPIPEDIERARLDRMTHPKAGSRSGNAKLTWADVEQIRRLQAEGDDCKSISQRFGVSKMTIRFIISGRTWNTPPCPTDDLEAPIVAIETPARGPKKYKQKPRIQAAKPRPARVATPCSTCGRELSIQPCKLRKHKDHYCSKPCKVVGMTIRVKLLMQDPARREHLAATNRGKRATPETRAKMSASQFARAKMERSKREETTDSAGLLPIP